jgi:hypothetical protein
MASTQWILTNLALSLGTVTLGSLVPNIHLPHKDAFFVDNLVQTGDLQIHQQKAFKGLMNSSQSSSLQARISKLFSASAHSASPTSNELATREGRIYELKNPKAKFKQLCTLQSARDWIEDGIRENEKSYFIIGISTFFDGEIKFSKAQSRGLSTAIDVPIDGGAMNGGAALLAGDIAIVGLSASHESNQENSFSSTVPGEQIYAVCYRRVKFKPLTKKSVDTSRLADGDYWAFRVDETRATAAEETFVLAELDDWTVVEDHVLPGANIESVEDGQREFFWLDNNSL